MLSFYSTTGLSLPGPADLRPESGRPDPAEGGIRAARRPRRSGAVRGVFYGQAMCWRWTSPAARPGPPTWRSVGKPEFCTAWAVATAAGSPTRVGCWCVCSAFRNASAA